MHAQADSRLLLWERLRLLSDPSHLPRVRVVSQPATRKMMSSQSHRLTKRNASYMDELHTQPSESTTIHRTPS